MSIERDCALTEGIGQCSNEAEFVMDDLNLVEFLNISDEYDESNENTNEYIRPCANIVTEKLCNVSDFQIKNRVSYKSVTDAIKLMNQMPGTQIKIPESKSTFQNVTAGFGPVQPTFLVFCDEC